MFLISSRGHAGLGIGSILVHHAAGEARAQGSEVLRVDCWAGASGLVRWYERQGFKPTEGFTVDGWRGQIFEMELGEGARSWSAGASIAHR